MKPHVCIETPACGPSYNRVIPPGAQGVDPSYASSVMAPTCRHPRWMGVSVCGGGDNHLMLAKKIRKENIHKGCLWKDSQN